MNNSRLAIAMRFRQAAQGAEFFDKLEAAVMFMVCETIATHPQVGDSDLEELISVSAERMRKAWPVFKASRCLPNPTTGNKT